MMPLQLMPPIKVRIRLLVAKAGSHKYDAITAGVLCDAEAETDTDTVDSSCEIAGKGSPGDNTATVDTACENKAEFPDRKEKRS